MFEVNGFKVTFQRIWTDQKRGRYDTFCEVNLPGDTINWPRSALAHLHPNDKPDKIVGKKIALGKALKRAEVGKELRTMIWKAFWAWVAKWPEAGYKERKPCDV